jgi:N-methylhydantoinase B
MSALMNYSERRFQAALRAIPDGTYFGQDAVDDDGLGDEPLVVKAAVTIKGEEVRVDYGGTCAQVKRNLNCPWASTVSATLAAIKSALTSPDIPFNEGFKRPISVAAPKGSLVNPHYPAPVRARLLPAYRCFNAVLKALAEVVPDQVVAGGNDSTHALAISYLGPKGYRVYLEIYGGGFGAGPRHDGCDAVDSPLSNCTNTPVEAADMDFEHFRVIGYGLLPDTGGPGKHRGGLGLFRRFLILKDGANFATYTDRVRLAPYGLFGGNDGSRTRIEIEREGKLLKVKSKDCVELKCGDILTLYSSGGGGYGPARQRDPGLIVEDIAQGYVSATAAAQHYGWNCSNGSG